MELSVKKEIGNLIIGIIVASLAVAIYSFVPAGGVAIPLGLISFGISFVLTGIIGPALYYGLAKNGLKLYIYFAGIGTIIGLSVFTLFSDLLYFNVIFGAVPGLIASSLFWVFAVRPLKNTSLPEKALPNVLRLIIILALAGLFTLGFRYELQAFIKKSLYSQEDLLVDQLNGKGCGFIHSCEFSYTDYSGRNIRNPEYNCPIQAAECMDELGVSPDISIPSIKKAVAKMPAEYNTGDGIIFYKKRLEEVIERIESKKVRGK
ncbi:MAG: hypothetical protein OEZ36_09370 [Spirochaetota bacterium]|nr:hypothetical protein [Spirochaetota bacterium]